MDTRRVTGFAVQQFSNQRHNHYMKALSCYSIFSQEEFHSAVTEKEPKVPGYKGRSSSVHFPTPFMGNTTAEKSLGTHLTGWHCIRQCLVVWCTGKMSTSAVPMWFQIDLCFGAESGAAQHRGIWQGSTLSSSLGQKQSQTGVISCVSKGQYGSLEKKNNDQ